MLCWSSWEPTLAHIAAQTRRVSRHSEASAEHELRLRLSGGGGLLAAAEPRRVSAVIRNRQLEEVLQGAGHLLRTNVVDRMSRRLKNQNRFRTAKTF